MFLFLFLLLFLLIVFPGFSSFDGCSEALRYPYNKGRANMN